MTSDSHLLGRCALKDVKSRECIDLKRQLPPQLPQLPPEMWSHTRVCSSTRKRPQRKNSWLIYRLRRRSTYIITKLSQLRAIYYHAQRSCKLDIHVDVISFPFIYRRYSCSPEINSNVLRPYICAFKITEQVKL